MTRSILPFLDRITTRVQSGDRFNEWFQSVPGTAVYLRATDRFYLGYGRHWTIEMANIEVQGGFAQGSFLTILRHLESFGYPVHVECVHEHRLHPLLLRLGYQRFEDLGAPSFFKIPEYILGRRAHVIAEN